LNRGGSEKNTILCEEGVGARTFLWINGQSEKTVRNIVQRESRLCVGKGGDIKEGLVKSRKCVVKKALGLVERVAKKKGLVGGLSLQQKGGGGRWKRHPHPNGKLTLGGQKGARHRAKLICSQRKGLGRAHYSTLWRTKGIRKNNARKIHQPGDGKGRPAFASEVKGAMCSKNNGFSWLSPKEKRNEAACTHGKVQGGKKTRSQNCVMQEGRRNFRKKGTWSVYPCVNGKFISAIGQP